MIVAAAIGAQDPWQDHQREPIQPHLADRRAHQAADENDVAAAGGAREPAEPSSLAEREPMVRITRDSRSIGEAADREQNHAAAAADNRFGDRIGQAPAAADDRERAVTHQLAAPRVRRAARGASAFINGRVRARE